VVSFMPLPLYPRGKSSRYPLGRRLGGPQSQPGRRGEDKILPPPEIELRPLGHEARSQSLYLLRYGSIPGRCRNFVFSTAFKMVLGAHPASSVLDIGGLFLAEVKPPGRKADISRQSSAEVKNVGAIPPLRLTSSWRGA
jgi:hypothetical protein